MAEPATTCAHCGLPSAPTRDGSPSFCCSGCRTVYELLHETGLSGYYPLRERLEAEASPGAARAEQAAEASSYVFLDDPAMLEQLAIAGRPGTAELRCTGLHCAACVWLIERLPQRLDPGVQARVDFGSGRLQLAWDPERVRLSAIASLLHRAGYEVHAVDAAAREAEREGKRRELVRLAVAGASAGNVMLVSFALYAGALDSVLRVRGAGPRAPGRELRRCTVLSVRVGGPARSHAAHRSADRARRVRGLRRQRDRDGARHG
jgi:Cu2+-exporting ATPase